MRGCGLILGTVLLVLLAARGEAADGVHLRLFYSTDLKGAVEPCG